MKSHSDSTTSVKKGQVTRLSRPRTTPRQTAHVAHQYVGGAHHFLFPFTHIVFARVSLNPFDLYGPYLATISPAHLITTPIRSRLVASIVSGHAPTGVRARGGEDGQLIFLSK
jgi:hypothetical protein